MKARTLLPLGAALALLTATIGCLKSDSTASQSTAADVETAFALQPVPTADDALADLADDDTDYDGVSEAPVTQPAAELVVPQKVQANQALAGLLKLARSGVDEEVLLAYVDNSHRVFDLGPDEIIYLTDVGLSGVVVQAMLQHDRVLKESAIASMQVAVETMPEQAPGLDQPSMAEPDTAATEPPPTDESIDSSEVPSEPSGIVSYNGFYDSLQPYGNWVDVEGYGRCWQPTVVVINRGWRPYCNGGHWAYTDCGWYWVSDYSWGWAPFHYGRWFQHAQLGWCWTPDIVWGPSWVTWRYNHDVCGWAPLPPKARFKHGQGVVVRGRPIHHDSDFGLKPGGYTFVHFKNLGDRQISRAVLPRQEVTRVFDRTIVSTRFSGDRQRIINDGLSPEQVTAVTQKPVPRLAVAAIVRHPRTEQPQPLQAGNRTIADVRLADARTSTQDAPTGVNGRPLVGTPVTSRPSRHELVNSTAREGNSAPRGGIASLQPETPAAVPPSAPGGALRRQPPNAARNNNVAATTRGRVQPSRSNQPEQFPPGSLVLRGKREVTDALPADSAPIADTGSPAASETRARSGRRAQGSAEFGQAVLPRTDSSDDASRSRYERPQPSVLPRQAQREAGAAMQVPRAVYQPLAQDPSAYRPAPVYPVHQPAAQQARAQEPAQMPQAPQVRNEPAERHSRAAAEAQPRQNANAESRSQPARSEPSRSSNRDDSGGGRRR